VSGLDSPIALPNEMPAMERFQRSNPTSERPRNRKSVPPGDKVIAKKRPSLGKAAGGFQSRFLASLRSRRKSADEELAPSTSRYVLWMDFM
jgi:hypothetical protein